MDITTVRPSALTTITTPADTAVLITDDPVLGVRATLFSDAKLAIAAAFAALPGTYNLAPLVAGKVPSANLPFTGALTFISSLAGASVPATATAAGYFYVIISAGTSQTITWAIGDWAVYNGVSGSWSKLTAATVQILGGGTGATTAAGARTNLFALSQEETYSGMATRAQRGGLYCDNVSTSKATGPACNLGLQDFTIDTVVSQRSWAPTVANIHFWTHTSGNNSVRLISQANAGQNMKLTFVDNVAGLVNLLFPNFDAPLIDGETYRFTVSVARSGVATLYVSGVTDRNFDTVAVSVSAAAAIAIDVGNGNANTSSIGFALDGVMYGCTVYNRALSAVEAMALTKYAVIPYADQWGDIANRYASDFSATADGWTAISTETLTGNTDGIGAVNDVLLIDSVAGTSCGAKRTILARTQGKRIRITYDLRIAGTNSATGRSFAWWDTSSNAVGFSARTPAVDTWATFIDDITTTANLSTVLAGRLIRSDTGGVVIAAADKFYLKNIKIEYVGAVRELDLGNADPSISTALMDLANVASPYTTLASGIYQIVPGPQSNISRLCVGAATVLKGIRSATAALDFPSIAAAGSADLTITVTGAAVGDACHLGLPSAPTAGIVFNTFVSATNTVTVRAMNITVGAVDPASATYRVTVLSF